MTDQAAPDKIPQLVDGVVALSVLMQAVILALKKEHPAAYAAVLEQVDIAKQHKIARLAPGAMALVDTMTKASPKDEDAGEF